MLYSLITLRCSPRALLNNSFGPRFQMQCLKPLVTTPPYFKQDEDFWAKNARLKRPLSPHLTIYKFQLTSMLSITHRTTGLIMATGLYGLALGNLLLPSNFPHYIDLLQSMHFGSAVIFTVKFGLAWTFFFHICNGIRHLAWDLGYGFEMKDLYKSGYVVLATSVLLAGLTANM